MPSYGKFRNAYRRNTELDNQFQNPAITKSTTIDGQRRDRIKDWITFYRRNIHLFIFHYFGIKLYPYQVFWIYMMSVSDSFVAICSRATGKTWLLAVFSCAKAVLYPNSEIVVVSSTKEQAGILVSDKITNLYNNYPNFAREISNIVTNMNKWEVTFHNGSVIKIVASRDSSRGKRATLILYEEFRLISLEVVNSVIRPFAYIRQTPYLKDPLYKNLGEEPKEVFISSAYFKNLWWFEETKKTIKSMMRGDNSAFIAVDFSVAIRHHIKTPRQIKNEIYKMDEITARMEYWNIPFGEGQNAYFRLKMFDKARNIKKAFYPQRPETYNPKKNPYGIPKIDGEIRIISCDTSQRVGPQNDLSVSSCIRLLPTQKGYFRELCYMISYSGLNSITQSLRIKQLYYDFEADYIVLDVAAGGGGLPMYDQLGILSKDSERGIEYPAMTIMNEPSIEPPVYDELSKRTLGLNAIPNIYPISATAKLNSLIAVQMRDKLQKKLWGFLVDETSAEDYLIRSSFSKEFLSQDDPASKSFFIAPFIQTSLTINQFINLSIVLLNGNLKLVEAPGARKDRYTSVSYGNYFAFLLDQTLIRENDNEDDFEFISKLIQSV